MVEKQSGIWRNALEDVGQQTAGHGCGVALPVLAVLVATAVLITNAAVHQQDGHVDDVKIRQQVLATAGQAVRQWAHQVPRVVHVTGHPPKPRGHQFALVNPTIGRLVWTLDEGGLLTPDFTVTLCATEKVFLVVGWAEDVVAHQTQDEDTCGMRRRKLDGVVDQVKALKNKNMNMT